VIKNQHMMF